MYLKQLIHCVILLGCIVVYFVSLVLIVKV